MYPNSKRDNILFTQFENVKFSSVFVQTMFVLFHRRYVKWNNKERQDHLVLYKQKSNVSIFHLRFQLQQVLILWFCQYRMNYEAFAD